MRIQICRWTIMSQCGICLIGAMYQGQLEHRKKNHKAACKALKAWSGREIPNWYSKNEQQFTRPEKDFPVLAKLLEWDEKLQGAQRHQICQTYGPCIPRSLNFILQPARGFSQGSLSSKVTCSHCLIAGLFWHQCGLKGQYWKQKSSKEEFYLLYACFPLDLSGCCHTFLMMLFIYPHTYATDKKKKKTERDLF